MSLIDLENKIMTFTMTMKELGRTNQNVSRHNIELDLRERVLMFNASCYTRECTTDKRHGKYKRQDIYKSIKNIHVSNLIAGGAKMGMHNSVRASNMPFGSWDSPYNLDLVHEQDNQHDPDSTMIIMSSTDHPQLSSVDGYNLGYVPGPFSYFIHENAKHFTNVKIRNILDDLPSFKGSTTPLMNIRVAILYSESPEFRVPEGKRRFTGI